MRVHSNATGRACSLWELQPHLVRVPPAWLQPLLAAGRIVPLQQGYLAQVEPGGASYLRGSWGSWLCLDEAQLRLNIVHRDQIERDFSVLPEQEPVGGGTPAHAARARKRAAVAAVHAHVEDFVGRYVYAPESARVLTERERAMLRDAALGLLQDTEGVLAANLVEYLR